ncbi:MAG: FAD-dependent oxidoreductase [Planctomycetota bacterium]
MGQHTEPARTIPVSGEYDVVVVGGGPAGIGAAFAAGRQGMRTLVIEQHNCLGGVGTAGGHGYMCRGSSWGSEEVGPQQVVGGIAWELYTRICREGHGDLHPGSAFYDVEAMKRLLDVMARECGVTVLYHTFFCDAVVRDGAITGVVIQNKAGRSLVRARRVIDCTGDGDVGFRAGCDWRQGRPEDGRCQPVTMMFTIGGVDWERVRAWRTDYKMRAVWERAQANGDMEPFQNQIMGWWWNSSQPHHVGVNFTHITGIDCTRAEDLTRATIEGRRQAWLSVDVYRKYVPGMEQCYLISTPNTVGLRESRRIMGEYVLSEEEVMAQCRFPDNVCYGSFFIDVHSLDGPGMSGSTWRPGPGFKYHIPYRCLVPQRVDNLLVAGRCISVTHVALGSTRVMTQCTGLGEAAGTAAAQSLSENAPPRAIDVGRLQSTLRANGGIIHDADIRPCSEFLEQA